MEQKLINNQEFPIKEISARGDFKIKIVAPSNGFAATVNGDESDLKRLKYSFSDGRLEVKAEVSSFFRSQTGTINLQIESDQIEKIQLRGTVGLTSKSPIKAPKIEIEVDGTGSVELPEIITELLTTSLRGSSRATLKGTAKEHHLSIDGSGNLNAKDLKTEKTHGRIRGSSNASLHACLLAQINAAGSYDVKIHGNPKLELKQKGSGNIEIE